MTASKSVESSFDVESFINEYYDAWSGTDLDRIMSYYAEDVVFQIPGAFMKGKEAVREQFARPFTTAFPGNHHVIKKMIRGSSVVTVEFIFEAKHTGPFAGRAATGVRIKLPGCGVYEYDAGKRQITSGRIYFDVATLLQSITLVNEPKEAVEALQLNERNLGVIINAIPTAAWTTRADGYCDFLNQRWLDYAGMTAQESEGWGWVEAIHPDDRQRLVEYWQAALLAGEPVEAEGRLRRFDSAYRWFLFRANPLRDQSGKIVKWYGTSVDIEDRKRVEEALRASELSWRQIVDNIPGLVATTGAMGEVEFLNRQTLEYFGRTRDELKDWALIDAVHPEDLPRVIEARRKSIEEGSVYDVEHRCRRADGVYRWFQVRGIPVRNEAGTITAWYLLLTDIDDRKKAEEALQASERNLSVTLNTVPTFIAVLSADGTILSANAAALAYHGISLEEVKRDDFRSRWHHLEDLTRLQTDLVEALKRPAPFEYELRALGKDGEYRWFMVRFNPLLDDQGRIDRWFGTAFDIEDRKRAEEALRKSERQFRLLVDTIPALVWRSTPQGELDYLNRRAVEYLGYTAESLAGDQWLELIHPAHRDATLQRWLNSATTGTAYEDEYLLRRADGQHRWIQSVGEPLLDTEGRIANWYGVVFDIDDRKRAEDALIRQAGVRADVSTAFSKPTSLEEILRGCMEAIVHHLDAAFARIWMLSKDESVLELQASAGLYTRLDGSYSRIPVGDLKVGLIAREKKAHLTNDVTNDPRVNDKAWARSNGMVAFAGYPLLVEDRLIGVVALFARHTLPESILDTLASVADTIAQGIERKRAEEKVRRSEAVLAQAQRLSKTGSFITDLLSDEHNWSEELRRIFEIDPGTKITIEAIRAFFHPEDLPVYEEAFKRAVAADQDIDITYRIITPAGKVKHLHAVSHLMDKSASQPVYIGAIQDITESKAAEEALSKARAELAHIARVTTLSALTASLSHEVNQPIAAAVTSAGACLRWLNREQPDIQKARDAAARIEQDGKRAAEIISHLRAFYKKDVSPQRELISVDELVEEMLLLLRTEADRYSVVMRTQLAADRFLVQADRVQLKQVLMNLMLNGMEAMSERGGELKVTSRPESGEVMVSVSDTGVGIPAGKMEEIFKAFVTTKEGGTGMGLAISSTIIESHKGRLWATANPDRGATFHFTLPTQTEAQSEH